MSISLRFHHSQLCTDTHSREMTSANATFKHEVSIQAWPQSQRPIMHHAIEVLLTKHAQATATPRAPSKLGT